MPTSNPKNHNPAIALRLARDAADRLQEAVNIEKRTGDIFGLAEVLQKPLDDLKFILGKVDDGEL